MMEITKFAGGVGFDLYSLVEDGNILIRDYLESLTDQADINQVLQILDLLREKGDPHNTQKFRHVGDEIWEIKTRNIRIMCFKSEPLNRNTEPLLNKSLILLHGYGKRDLKPQRLKRAVDKAKLIRKDYFEGEIRIIET